MDFSTILRPEAVKVISATSSKKLLLQDFGDLAANAYGLKAPEVVSACQATVAWRALGRWRIHERCDSLDFDPLRGTVSADYGRDWYEDRPGTQHAFDSW